MLMIEQLSSFVTALYGLLLILVIGMFLFRLLPIELLAALLGVLSISFPILMLLISAHPRFLKR